MQPGEEPLIIRKHWRLKEEMVLWQSSISPKTFRIPTPIFCGPMKRSKSSYLAIYLNRTSLKITNSNVKSRSGCLNWRSTEASEKNPQAQTFTLPSIYDSVSAISPAVTMNSAFWSDNRLCSTSLIFSGLIPPFPPTVHISFSRIPLTSQNSHFHDILPLHNRRH